MEGRPDFSDGKRRYSIAEENGREADDKALQQGERKEVIRKQTEKVLQVTGENDIIDIEKLASYTPKELKALLEGMGFEVKPLAKGALKDLPFEQGGGFKINFADGGLLQYHPDKKSHHGGAYYKISTGKGGVHRYGLDGKEKF